MKTKLMISALLFCSSLAVASDVPEVPSTRLAKKKMVKPSGPPTTDKAQQVEETVLGGLGTGISTAPAKKARGTGGSEKK
ncbi:MAG: hypothetical protein Q8N23_08990 [Archangium sp.]|nr:hypothetical protein [Archangium sp.]MDP3573580.1 hypothetical protein [Archangium sp.]